MNKTTIIIITIVLPLFAVEFVLSGSRGRNTSKDSLELQVDSSIYIDSAEVATFEGTRGQTIIGQRSRASITRGIDKNANTIRKEYNNHILQGNKLIGGLIVRFKITSKGDVVECRIVQSNTEDPIFDKNVVMIIKRWKFPPINIENDTTIVEYPFVFDQLW